MKASNLELFGDLVITGAGSATIGDGTGIAQFIVDSSGTSTQMLRLQADLGTNDRNMVIRSPQLDSVSDPFIFATGNAFAFEIDSQKEFTIDANGNITIGEDNETEARSLTINASGAGNDARINLVNQSKTWIVYADEDSNAFRINDDSTTLLRITSDVFVQTGLDVSGNSQFDGNVTTDGVITLTALTSAGGNYLAVNGSGEIIDSGVEIGGGGGDATTITADGSNVTTMELSGGIPTSMVPEVSGVYDLGSPSLTWRHLYINQNSLYMGANQVSSDGSTLSVNSTKLMTGNKTISPSFPTGGQNGDVWFQVP